MKLRFRDGHEEHAADYRDVLDYAEAADTDTENEGTVMERLSQVEEFMKDRDKWLYGYANESKGVVSQRQLGHN